MAKKATKLKVTPVPAPAASLKLDLGCGPNKREGFIGVDCLPFDGKVDIVFNLAERALPGFGIPVDRNTGKDLQAKDGWIQWPWADESVAEAHSSHFIEHLNASERIQFYNEL